MDTRIKGQEGERLAVQYLQKKGYRIQQQNYRCRYGEVDIIAWDGTNLVFVEVKSKSQKIFGAPEAMVGVHKQRKIVYVAMAYVQQHKLQNTSLRFDVVAIYSPQNQAPAITHIPGAFHATADFLY